MSLKVFLIARRFGKTTKLEEITLACVDKNQTVTIFTKHQFNTHGRDGITVYDDITMPFESDVVMCDDMDQWGLSNDEHAAFMKRCAGCGVYATSSDPEWCRQLII